MAQVNVAIQITSNYRGGPGFQKAERDVKKFRRQVGRAANSVRAFQFVLAGVAISTLTIWGKKLVDVSSSLQLLQIRLNNVEGSAAAGQKTFNNLFETFKNAPFDINKTIDGFVRLRAAGLNTEKATGLVKALVDATALFGGTDQEFQRATIGFQQVAGKGVLSMEELRQQIGEAVPAAMAIMSREAGTNIALFVERVKNGMITAEEAIRLFTEGAKKQFGGFADSLAPTISGTIARVRNEITQAFKGFLDRTDFLARVAAMIQLLGNRIVGFIKSLDQGTVDKFFSAFEGVADVIFGVVRVLGLLLAAIGRLIGFIGNVFGSAAGDGAAVGVIGTMLFGRRFGLLLGIMTFVTRWINDIGKQFHFNEADLARIADIQRQMELARGNPEEFKRLAKIRDQAVRNMRAGSGEQRNALGGNLFPTKEEIEALVEDLQEGLDNIKTAELRRGIIGLGADAANVSSDILTLGERAKIASEGGFASFTKQISRMRDDARDLEARIAPLRSNFETQAKELQDEINKLSSTGAPEDLKRAAQLQEDLDFATQKTTEALSRMNGQLGAARNHINNLEQRESKDFFSGLEEKINRVSSANDRTLAAFPPLQLALGDVNQKYFEQTQNLLEIERGLESMNTKQYPEAIRLLKMVRAEIERTEQARTKEAEVTRRNADFDVRILRQKLAITEEESRQRIQASQKEMETGLQILLRDEMSNRVKAIKNRLTLELLNLNLEIAQRELELAIAKDQQNEAEIKALERILELKREIAGQIVKQREETTTTGELEKQVWTNVGNIIRNSVGNAIEGVITGHMSLKEAGLQMWRALIREAAQYIVKLLFIKALGFLGGGNPLLTPAAFGGGIVPFAQGGSFKGRVKPFADGGLVRGPTMFGLAGEAGTEAIMPLKRIGGKLGVRADGAGGDHYSITIQAIDTQTGTNFLMNHMETIVQGLQHETSLNRGFRRG